MVLSREAAAYVIPWGVWLERRAVLQSCINKLKRGCTEAMLQISIQPFSACTKTVEAISKSFCG
jgi:hypothetical protein